MINLTKLKKIFQYKEVLIYLSNKKIFHYIPDPLFLKFKFRLLMGRKLDLKNPKTFNEKLQWLKINDRKPYYSNLVDKYGVRKFIEDKIGSQYLIPLHEVYDSFDQIDFKQLPNQFVLKTTHDSGGVVICKDKTKLDINAAKKKIEKSMANNYYWRKREWVYKNVKPRIIVEKYMEDNSGSSLKDYKFFCFNGKPEFMFIASDRSTDTKFDFFDMNFNNIPVQQHYRRSENPLEIKKPEMFEEMKALAGELSKGFRHLRVDFYNINGKIYFGELTFYHFSGTEKFEPAEYDEIFGSLLDIH